MPSTVEAVRAAALFASHLQSSDKPADDEIRHAVAVTLRQLGSRGCATRVAGEFGEHPETAVSRMTWALEMVRHVYPTPPACGAGAREFPAATQARPLAMAS